MHGPNLTIPGTDPAAGHPEGVAPEPGATLARVSLLSAWGIVVLIHFSLSADQRMLGWPLCYLGLEVLAAASLTWRAWRTEGPGRGAWWLLTASVALEVLNLAARVLLAQGPRAAWAEAANIPLSVATGILALAGVLSFPRGRESAGPLRRRILDSLIFAVALLFLLRGLGALSQAPAPSAGIVARVLVAYLNAALLGGGLIFMTSYDPNRFRGPLGWLGASALAWFVAQSVWILSGLPGAAAREGWIILVGGIPIFQALAAWSPRPVVEASGDDNRQLLSDLLPYAPVAVSVGVLALLLIWMPKAVTRGSIAIFLVLMVLLLLRQFQAIRDLQRGGRTLEDSVVKRTKALEQAQDALLRTERMNAIALMGAGLAHDLNNLLSAMKSSAELIAMNQEDGLPPLPKDLERIITSADRAAELTRRLMRFVRREEEASAPLDLGPEVQDMGPTLRLLLPRAVLLEVEVQPGPPLVVQTSRLRLEQMLVNLAANARDAMPAGGRLRVYAGADPSGDRNAMIEVADTGVGIPADILDRICDPFFTTKPPGKGTGLGLASVKAMVEEDGGRLEVASELGQGARFRLLLPLSEGGAITPH